MQTPMDDWYKVIAKFGLPSVAVVYLIWLLSNDVTSQLKAITNFQQMHQIDTGYYIKSVEELKSQADRSNLILQQICVNGANIQDRQNCFR